LAAFGKLKFLPMSLTGIFDLTRIEVVMWSTAYRDLWPRVALFRPDPSLPHERESNRRHPREVKFIWRTTGTNKAHCGISRAFANFL